MRRNPDMQHVAAEVADDCIGSRVRMLNRLVTRCYDEALRPYGLRCSQMNILAVIAKLGSVQPAEIVRLIAIEKSTLSRNVRLMEQSGWIALLPGDQANTQKLRLTPRGRNLLRRAVPAWEEVQAEVAELLGGQTLTAIRRATRKMHAEDLAGSRV